MARLDPPASLFRPSPGSSGDSPNQACCSPCTSMARPKSASLTAAPFSLLARSRFSGCGWKRRVQPGVKGWWGVEGAGPGDPVPPGPRSSWIFLPTKQWATFGGRGGGSLQEVRLVSADPRADELLVGMTMAEEPQVTTGVCSEPRLQDHRSGPSARPFVKRNSQEQS